MKAIKSLRDTLEFLCEGIIAQEAAITTTREALQKTIIITVDDEGFPATMTGVPLHMGFVTTLLAVLDTYLQEIKPLPAGYELLHDMIRALLDGAVLQGVCAHSLDEALQKVKEVVEEHAQATEQRTRH